MSQSSPEANAPKAKQPSRQSWLESFFLDMWYKKRLWAWLLLPISWLYQLLFAINRRQHKKRETTLPVPVVVVGNISVGGTGKTPVIIALAKALSDQQMNVGVISRGYGSSAEHYPHEVSKDDNAHVAGDEPLLIAKTANCPVVIGKDRIASAKALLGRYPNTQIILSDDGLQHHKLVRDLEIVVVDSSRGLGNHLCLPAGPLREPASRLASVDWILINQSERDRQENKHTAQPEPNRETDLKETSPEEKDPAEKEQQNGPKSIPNKSQLAYIHLAPKAWRHISTGQCYPLNPLPWGQANFRTKAVAGIGNPERFFNSLRKLGVDGDTYAFDDHHPFSPEDFAVWADEIVLMTEKDAVKCQGFSHPQLWSLVVDIDIPEPLLKRVVQLAQGT